jgi:C-terminal processing protease CtpA/Prc
MMNSSNKILAICLSFLIAVVVGACGKAPADAPAHPSDLWRGYPRLSPFQAVRWRGDVPEVRVGGTWYELLKLDGLPAKKIVATCKVLDDDAWQKRFEEDLVAVLTSMGDKPGDSATLVLKDPSSEHVQTLTGVAMSEENRDAIRDARQEVEDGPLTRDQAQQDLDATKDLLETNYSYLKLRGVDYKTGLAEISHGLADSNDQASLEIQLQKMMARFGDGHSGIDDFTEALPAGFAPFLLGDTEEGLVVFRADHSDFLDANFPYLRSLDGVPVEEWLAAARRIVPDVSPQFVRNDSIRMLRYVNYLRGELGLPPKVKLSVELDAGSSGPVKVLQLPLAAEKPIYGTWPRGADRILSGDIGYLRLGTMDDSPAFTQRLTQAMRDFRQTRGLIIDVRDNGGGVRDGLRQLFPYFLSSTDGPRVVNVAAYRLKSGDDPNAPEGYLANRALYPLTSHVWWDQDRVALRQFAETFKPAWTLPDRQFSAWHYAVIKPASGSDVYYYARPVVILMNSQCFSATDIFLGAFKGWRNVTLMGTASGGGSGRVDEFPLPNGRIRLRLCSMASFQPNGRLYEAHGTIPDVTIRPIATDWIGKTDSVLAAAVARLDGEHPEMP